MDRLVRILAGGGLAGALALVVCVSGCRSMRSEVPPGKPYPTHGGTPPTVGFSSDPRANPSASAGQWSPGTSMTPGNSVPDGGTGLTTGSQPQFGTPTPNSSSSGAPSGYRYGAPSTSTSTTPTSP
jgi:hypothetical protein